MQLVDVTDAFPWKWLCANDQFVCGRTGKSNPRFQQQHAELVDERSDERCHHARDIHFHIGERFNERESNGDDYIYPYSNQCRWLNNSY